MSMLFVSARGAGVSGALCSSMPGLEGSQSLRRASSIRRTFTAVKRKNVCLQVKFTVVSINYSSVFNICSLISEFSIFLGLSKCRGINS